MEMERKRGYEGKRDGTVAPIGRKRGVMLVLRI